MGGLAELMNHRDLPLRRLNDVERVGRGKHARKPVGHAELARAVGDRAVLQAGDVFLIGGLARRVSGSSPPPPICILGWYSVAQ
jgi:hypothetical protein